MITNDLRTGWYSPLYTRWRCCISAYFGKSEEPDCQPGTAGMSLRELFIILLLVVLLVLLGFYPQPILDTSHSAMEQHPAVVC